MDYVREDLKEKNIQKPPGLVKRPKNKQKGSLEESCESLNVGTAEGREERRRRYNQTVEHMHTRKLKFTYYLNKPINTHNQSINQFSFIQHRNDIVALLFTGVMFRYNIMMI